MDILIKNNIIKKNKLVVDIGMYATKVLEVHYAAKIITVTSAKSIINKGIIEENSINFSELARKINIEISGQGKSDVCVSLPADFCENKIISIKNKKESEIPKIIKKDYMTFGRANPITHVVDYAFIGKREEEGDTVFYYLISAVQKSIAAELVTVFAKHKMKVKTIVSSIYNQICLSEMYFDEYEHLNRLFIDFGTNTTRVTAFSEGMAVYTRSIEIGFNSYVDRLFTAHETAGKPELIKTLSTVGLYTELAPGILNECFDEMDIKTYKTCVNEIGNYILNDISRIIDLCGNNDFSVTKIYCTGYIIKGFAKIMQKRFDVDFEDVAFNTLDEKEGKGYRLEIDDINFDKEFSNALGLCIYPML